MTGTQPANFTLWPNAAYGSTLWGGGPSVSGNTGNTLGGQDTSLVNPYTNEPFDLTTNFEEDCLNGNLPAVSWIFPPATSSEHPSYLPAAGAEFIASKIAAIAQNPDLWNSTVFIIDWDENDGMFDHVPPIVPPAGTPNEFVTLESPGGTPGGGLPVGSGFRVPCLIVSPWTTGGYVYTEPLDHTSCLMFLEQVFFSGQPVCTNIERMAARHLREPPVGVPEHASSDAPVAVGLELQLLERHGERGDAGCQHKRVDGIASSGPTGGQPNCASTAVGEPSFCSLSRSGGRVLYRCRLDRDGGAARRRTWAGPEGQPGFRISARNATARGRASSRFARRARPWPSSS